MIEDRKKELNGMTNTKSFIAKNKLTKKDKIYDIHDNEGRPYRVIANNTGISIYEVTCYYEDRDEIVYNTLVKKIKNFRGYWSGFDSSPYKMHGNSILIQLSKYIYIYMWVGLYINLGQKVKLLIIFHQLEIMMYRIRSLVIMIIFILCWNMYMIE